MVEAAWGWVDEGDSDSTAPADLVVTIGPVLIGSGINSRMGGSARLTFSRSGTNALSAARWHSWRLPQAPARRACTWRALGSRVRARGRGRPEEGVGAQPEREGCQLKLTSRTPGGSAGASAPGYYQGIRDCSRYLLLGTCVYGKQRPRPPSEFAHPLKRARCESGLLAFATAISATPKAARLSPPPTRPGQTRAGALGSRRRPVRSSPTSNHDRPRRRRARFRSTTCPFY